MASQSEIRQAITDRIIEALESGSLPPWRRPWLNHANSGLPTNVISKRRYPLPTVMDGLVMGRPIAPGRGIGLVKITGAKLANLVRTHSGMALQHYHVGQRARKMQKGSLNDFLSYRPDWVSLPSLGTPRAETGNCRQRLVDLRGQQFLGYRPLEHSPDSIDVLIDHASAKVLLDEPLPQCLQCERRELCGRVFAVQAAKVLHCRGDARNFTGRRAVRPAVIAFTVDAVPIDQFRDSEIRRATQRFGLTSATSQPFTQNAITLATCLRLVVAQIDFAAVQRDVVAAAVLVLAEFR